MITDEMKMDAIQHYRDEIIGTRRVADMLYREDELSQRSRLNSVFYAIKYHDGDTIRQYFQYVGVYFDMECTESEDGKAKVKFTKVDEYSYRTLYDPLSTIPHRDENLDGIIAAFDRRFARRRPRR